MIAAVILAAGAELGVPNWVGELAFGAVVIMAILGFVWFKPAVDDLRRTMEARVATAETRADRAEAQRDALIEVYQDQVIPTLKSAADAQEEVVTTLAREVSPLLVEVRSLLLSRRNP